MRSFLFLLGSSRLGGNTETLARNAAENLPTNVEQQWFNLATMPLTDYADRRHVPGNRLHAAPQGTEKLLLDATVAATDIVIASPTYWYTVSSSTKRYLDYWSDWFDIEELGFKGRMAGKRLWVITALSEEPHQADALIDTLRRSAEYLKMEFGGALTGNGSKPDDVLADTEAMANAKVFFASV
ncbi:MULTISPECIES: flavodoxin family protein [unclassified Crossiella]|uniref:flavodoxin family protein n=1 Tax=unclassified Crossiella TaxID=2620835 RepID=UPI001FFE9CE8|nr:MULTISPECIES: NAD(P)H-dependent oxidoreductase [unclassified Crossiella]MCK2242109.1 NAD(P)H-dependent oxidoreductase [Crossiella sp. S99.2]MCK2256012.1 NAD(P)H-dependent oxidoreductase [Crossiella sp. S99.1]